MAENTRLGGIKQEFQELKNSFQVMISDLRLEWRGSLKTPTRDFRN